MESLTDRAERAVLGAMITSPAHFARLGYLTPDDFADPRHSAVYTGLARAINTSDLATDQWHAAIAMAGGRQVSAGYVEELAAACPDPDHAAAYATMVLQARLTRQLARRADELTCESAELGRDASRLTTGGGTGNPPIEDLAEHLANLAAAFRLHAEKLGPPRDHPGLVLVPDPATQQPQSQAPETSQQRYEERVLSALLQGHRDSGQVLAFLPVAAFVDPSRQELFQAIRSLDAAGTPVDPLTVDWELARRGVPLVGDAESRATHLARAEAGDESPAKATTVLLTRLDRRTSLAPANAELFPRPAQASAAVPGRPGPRLQLVQPPPGVTAPNAGPEPRM